MASKFYIYKSHRWLELDLTSGTLEGTREKLRFLYVKDGTLQLARHSKILRGLRALQSGRPTCLVEGLPLLRRRRKVRRYRSPIKPASHQCCSCFKHSAEVHSCPTPITINNIQQGITTSTQHLISSASIPQVLPQVTVAKTVNTLSEKPACQPDTCQDDNDSSESRDSPVKELFIDEDDVRKIRNYLAGNPTIFGDFDKEKFDTDDQYRNVVLFKLNPLVRIVKKGNLEGLIKQHKRPNKKEHLKSTAEEMSQKEFVATLGLTHILDQPAKPAYRTRQKLEKLSNNSNKPKSKELTSSSGSEDKENSSRSQNSKLAEIFKKKNKRDIQKRDSEKERNLFKRKSMMLRKLKAGKKSLCGVREYTSIEDHAIVAWVSVGGRERRVNGNKIWRELSREYTGITGLERSWHSLRNRYLRYILPSLGKLRLPPQQESKLRAAAARGELNLRRKRSLNRRNSIHPASPAKGAWTRRPRHDGTLSPHARHTRGGTMAQPVSRPGRGGTLSKQVDSSGDEYQPKAIRKSQRAATMSPDQPSPVRKLRSSALTYSDITEAFARRHKDTSIGSGQASLPPSPPPATKPGRRLFNPKTTLNTGRTT